MESRVKSSWQEVKNKEVKWGQAKQLSLTHRPTGKVLSTGSGFIYQPPVPLHRSGVGFVVGIACQLVVLVSIEHFRTSSEKKILNMNVIFLKMSFSKMH